MLRRVRLVGGRLALPWVVLLSVGRRLGWGSREVVLGVRRRVLRRVRLVGGRPVLRLVGRRLRRGSREVVLGVRRALRQVRLVGGRLVLPLVGRRLRQDSRGAVPGYAVGCSCWWDFGWVGAGPCRKYSVRPAWRVFGGVDAWSAGWSSREYAGGVAGRGLCWRDSCRTTGGRRAPGRPATGWAAARHSSGFRTSWSGPAAGQPAGPARPSATDSTGRFRAAHGIWPATIGLWPPAAGVRSSAAGTWSTATGLWFAAARRACSRVVRRHRARRHRGRHRRGRRRKARHRRVMASRRKGMALRHRDTARHHRDTARRSRGTVLRRRDMVRRSKVMVRRRPGTVRRHKACRHKACRSRAHRRRAHRRRAHRRRARHRKAGRRATALRRRLTVRRRRVMVRRPAGLLPGGPPGPNGYGRPAGPPPDNGWSPYGSPPQGTPPQAGYNPTPQDPRQGYAPPPQGQQGQQGPFGQPAQHPGQQPPSGYQQPPTSTPQRRRPRRAHRSTSRPRTRASAPTSMVPAQDQPRDGIDRGDANRPPVAMVGVDTSQYGVPQVVTRDVSGLDPHENTLFRGDARSQRRSERRWFPAAVLDPSGGCHDDPAWSDRTSPARRRRYERLCLHVNRPGSRPRTSRSPATVYVVNAPGGIYTDPTLHPVTGKETHGEGEVLFPGGINWGYVPVGTTVLRVGLRPRPRRLCSRTRTTSATELHTPTARTTSAATPPGTERPPQTRPYQRQGPHHQPPEQPQPYQAAAGPAPPATNQASNPAQTDQPSRPTKSSPGSRTGRAS